VDVEVSGHEREPSIASPSANRSTQTRR
jgi:hypothetical protein